MASPSRSRSAELGTASAAGAARAASATRATFSYAEPTDEDLGRQRLDVRLPCKSGVDGLQAFGRLEQQRRCLAAAPLGKHNVSAQTNEPCALQLVQRTALGGGQKRERRARRAGLELCLRGSERSGPAPTGIERELSGALEKCGNRGHASPALRSISRSFQLIGDCLIGSERCVGTVPRPAIGVDTRVGYLGERSVHLLPLSRGRRAIGRRARQCVPKAHPLADLDQSVRLGRSGCAPADPEYLGRAPQHGCVSNRLCSGGEEKSLRVCRERSDAADKALLDTVGHWPRVRTTETARQCCGGQPLWQLQQSERISIRFRDDPIAHAFVHPPECRGIEERARIRVTQTIDHHHRKSPEISVVARVAHGEYHCNRLRQEPPRYEAEHLCRSPIEPLRIIDDADQRPLLGALGQQTQKSHPDEKAIGGRTGHEPECSAKRVALRGRQFLQVAQQRRTELMDAGKRELHFGLDSCASLDATL